MAAHNGTVLVASVSIIQDGKMLVIREGKPAVRYQWNLPSGRIEPGEDIPDAARREAKEETGYEVELTGTTGIYHFQAASGAYVILFHFTGEIIGGSLQLEEGMLDCKWITAADLLASDCRGYREPALMKQLCESLLHGKMHSLDLYYPVIRQA
ncbi:adenosine nucleotide hydrolase NudE [Paenibacillus konkukensis]|uniref:Adenosine nucleotide hydrolase NudE n=2 Tax=Paenibacillus TaxID=44249 RepID=A0ABY4S301_9BACL|nr:adenosine nucleotide hydrolase NudE [Paenibacillus konkukensis]